MVYSGSGSNLSRNSGSGSEHDFYSLGNMFGYIVDDDCYRFYKYFSIKWHKLCRFSCHKGRIRPGNVSGSGKDCSWSRSDQDNRSGSDQIRIHESNCLKTLYNEKRKISGKFLLCLKRIQKFVQDPPLFMAFRGANPTTQKGKSEQNMIFTDFFTLGTISHICIYKWSEIGRLQ